MIIKIELNNIVKHYQIGDDDANVEVIKGIYQFFNEIVMAGIEFKNSYHESFMEYIDSSVGYDIWETKIIEF